MRCATEPPEELVPRVQRVVSLLRAVAARHPQGPASEAYPHHYPDEFTFRFKAVNLQAPRHAAPRTGPAGRRRPARRYQLMVKSIRRRIAVDIEGHSATTIQGFQR